LIQTSLGSHTLYSYNAQQYFVPASNAKLLTTAAVLHHLGSQFRIRTSVYGSGDGALRVVGRGDPSFTDTQLTELAIQLSRQGIRQVNQLIGKMIIFVAQLLILTGNGATYRQITGHQSTA
jgi:D-alanyl-D-alanine carboxypeptidase/D-alanyl-D-alanine-endopeptidase (penicillin-binding protein 4)